MVDAVLLILRKVLEAALIVSLLLALTYKLGLHYGWSVIALTAGFIGSIFLAHYAALIAEAVDGRGQELLNAILYVVVIISVIWVGFIICHLFFTTSKQNRIDYQPFLTQTSKQHLLIILCGVIVSFSLAREGSEIWIYFSSFDIQSQSFYSALIGAAIGIGIGMSLGGITYYLLVFLREKYFIPGFLIIVTLLSGGLSMQVAKQLMQIGVLNSSGPLWDSSFLVDEQSWFGELLYALFGYDAQPTSVQVIFYLAAIAPMVMCLFWHLRSIREKMYAHKG